MGFQDAIQTIIKTKYAFWHSVEEINGKLDGIWEMCVFAIDSPLWCFLSAWNEWEVVSVKIKEDVGGGERQTDKQRHWESKSRYYFQSQRKVCI